MPWAAAAPALIEAGGGIASSFINRPPKQQQPQRMRQFRGAPNIEELLYNLLMSQMARQSMFRPSMLNNRARNILRTRGGFSPSQMGAPPRGLITGGQ